MHLKLKVVGLGKFECVRKAIQVQQFVQPNIRLCLFHQTDKDGIRTKIIKIAP